MRLAIYFRLSCSNTPLACWVAQRYFQLARVVLEFLCWISDPPQVSTVQAKFSSSAFLHHSNRCAHRALLLIAQIWARFAENRATSSSIGCHYSRRSALLLFDSNFACLPWLGRALPLLVVGSCLSRALYWTLNQYLRCYRSSSRSAKRYRYRDTARRRKRYISPHMPLNKSLSVEVGKVSTRKSKKHPSELMPAVLEDQSRVIIEAIRQSFRTYLDSMVKFYIKEFLNLVPSLHKLRSIKHRYCPRNYSGCIGALDCILLMGKNFPEAWKGQYHNPKSRKLKESNFKGSAIAICIDSTFS
eukprot:IDg2964t1